MQSDPEAASGVDHVRDGAEQHHRRTTHRIRRRHFCLKRSKERRKNDVFEIQTNNMLWKLVFFYLESFIRF